MSALVPRAARALLAGLLALGCGACVSLSPAQRERAEAITVLARSTVIECQRADACAQPSSLHALGARALAASTDGAPRHFALILDRGPDAMLARINLIRSATRSIDLQTYIFDEDDAGHLVLDELLVAARRGVRVRVLIDQLSALKRVETLAALAGAHAGFSIRIYNPVLSRARINYPQYLLAAACCWRKLNQRMHTKLLLVDGVVGISGGRNYQDDYYDWASDYNFRDRDVLVAGPATRDMADNFDTFWDDVHSRPAEQLSDVGRLLLHDGVPTVEHPVFEQPQRVAAMSRDADDDALVQARLTDHALAVGRVRYLADVPQKHSAAHRGPAHASEGLRDLIDAAQHEVLLQTPYLVLSRPAQQLFRAMHQRDPAPRVIVSTNSLASTDSFITYALSYKYKRRYLRDFGFEIHEFKPFPADAPIDIGATGATLAQERMRRWFGDQPVPEPIAKRIRRSRRASPQPRTRAAATRRCARWDAREIAGGRRAHRGGGYAQLRSTWRSLQHRERRRDRGSRIRTRTCRQHPA